jgi:hypothetical protein
MENTTPSSAGRLADPDYPVRREAPAVGRFLGLAGALSLHRDAKSRYAVAAAFPIARVWKSAERGVWQIR